MVLFSNAGRRALAYGIVWRLGGLREGNERGEEGSGLGSVLCMRVRVVGREVLIEMISESILALVLMCVDISVSVVGLYSVYFTLETTADYLNRSEVYKQT
jgi:hypothetical protein